MVVLSISAVTAIAWGDRLSVEVIDGEYDNIVQSLMTAEDLSGEVVVLIPWNQTLLAAGESTGAERLSSAMEVWQLAWERVAERGGSRPIPTSRPGGWG